MRWLIILTVLMVIATPASAQEAYTDVSPEDIWLGEHVTIGCCFTEEPGGDVIAEISSPIYVRLEGFSGVNETCFSREYTPPVIGEYSIACGNGSTDSTETGFTVSRLETEIMDGPGQSFTDQGIMIEATVIKNSGTENHVMTPDFSVSLNGEDIPVSGTPYFQNERWVIETENLDGFDAGNYVLRLEAEYGGSMDWDEISLDVMGPLEFSIESVSPEEARGGENITVNLRAYYHNSSVLSESEITASLDGVGLEIKRTSSGFTFTCPDIEPESHTLEVHISYAGFVDDESVPLYYMIPVQTEIRNGDNGGVSASIRFLGEDGWQKSVHTNVNGAFTSTIPAGTYTIEMGFPASVSARAEGIEIKEALNDFVRFDTFSTGEIDGIRVAKAFAMEFSLGFDSMVITSEYDGSAVDDESEIELYTCDDWNIDSRTCQSDWDDIDFEIDSMQNEVEFSVDHFSGFIVGSRGRLFMDASIDREEYISGQDIRISGVVKDEDGRPVGGVTVEYSVSGDGEEVKTNSNGVFSASMAAPSSGGEYEVTLRASKGHFRRDTNTIEFSVLTSREFTIMPPLKADVTEGSDADIEVIVVNTGQETLRNFKVSISGIPEEWYIIEPDGWGSLKPDEQKSVTLKISPSEATESVYTVSIQVSSDETEGSDSFVLYVNPMEEDVHGETVKAASPSEGESTLDYVTIYLTGSYEAVINTASIIISVVVLAFIARGLKRNRGRDRTWLLSLLESVKSEVRKQTTRQKASRREKVIKAVQDLEIEA